MTSEEEKAVLLKAVEEVAGRSVPFETTLSHLCAVARRLHAESADPQQPCKRCGVQLNSPHLVDGYCVGCVRTLLELKGVSLA